MANPLTAEEIIYVLKANIRGFERDNKKAGDEAEKQGNRISRAFQSVGSSAHTWIAGASVTAIAAGTAALVKMGDEQTTVSRGFSRLASAAGQSSSEMLAAMRRGVRGTVADLELMKQANQALLLGIPATAEQMEEMTNVAHRLGRAVGRDTKDAVGDLITGFGRMSIELLDNLGITIRAEEAYAAYAARLGKSANDLDDAERRLAFFTIGMEKAKLRADQLGESVETASDRAKRAGVIFQNFATSFGQRLSMGLDDIANGSGVLGKLLQSSGILGQIEEFNKRTEQLVALRGNDPVAQQEARVAGTKDELAAAEAQLEKLKSNPRASFRKTEENVENLKQRLADQELVLQARKKNAVAAKEADDAAKAAALSQAEKDEKAALALAKRKKAYEEWVAFRDDNERGVEQAGYDFDEQQAKLQEFEDEYLQTLADLEDPTYEFVELVGEGFEGIPRTFEDEFMNSLGNIEAGLYQLSGRGRSFFSGIGQVKTGLKGFGITGKNNDTLATLAPHLEKIGGALSIAAGTMQLMSTMASLNYKPDLTQFSNDDLENRIDDLEAAGDAMGRAGNIGEINRAQQELDSRGSPTSASVAYNQTASITATQATSLVGDISALRVLAIERNSIMRSGFSETNAHLRNIEFHSAVGTGDRISRFAGRGAA